MKVLYAEDEQQMSVAVTEILRMEGFDVTAVSDGVQAWDAIQNGYYDAVILDVMMPQMDGFEVLMQMRKSNNHTPVMMLTAKASVEDRVSGLSEGADDYLSKPFAMKELVARLQALTRREGDYRHSSMAFSNITLDGASGELRTSSGSLRLNNDEADVLTHFIKNPNVAFTLEEVNEIVWSGRENADKAELYIFYLRNKLRQIHADANFSESADGYLLTESTVYIES